MAPRAVPLIDRLVLRTRKATTGCILWTARLDRHGYGVLAGGGRGSAPVLAHRACYEFFVGAVPDGLCVLHNCPGGDNRACVNPNHLWLGTVGQNNTDRANKGRNGNLRGEAHPNTPLTEQQVRELRRRREAGEKLKVLAFDYGLCKQAVSDIAHGKRWGHLT